MKTKLHIFQNQKIRTAWNEETEEWLFSIVDVVRILTEQPSHERARNYWKVLKNRLKAEGNQTVTNCNQLKLQANNLQRKITKNSKLIPNNAR